MARMLRMSWLHRHRHPARCARGSHRARSTGCGMSIETAAATRKRLAEKYKYLGASARGQRRIAELARSKGLRLYRGHGFGCAFEIRDHAPDGTPGEYAYQAYSILRDTPREGSDPTAADSYLVLCRITLPEAERYLTDGIVPEGHSLYELSPYEDDES